MTPARGGDRTDRRHRCRVSASRVLSVLVIVGLGAGNVWWSPPAVAAGKAHGAHHPASSKPSLTLLAPPTVAGPSSPFTVRLGRAGEAPAAGLTLGITVYAPLSTPTAFSETLDGSPVGSVVARSPAVGWSTLTPDPNHENGVDLSLPVSAGGVTGAGTGPYTVDLHCSLGSCGGVYPVQLVLTDTASHTTSKLLTYLAYTDPSADNEPLRFALVVPLNLAPSPSGPDPEPAVTAPSLATLNALVEAISGPRSTVPLTVVPSPATLAALHAASGERARSALSSLVSLTAEPGRQTLCESFVPVNASSLGAAELAEQVRRGDQVLDAEAGLRPTCVTRGAWVSDTTLDVGALGALGALGYNDVVVPPSAVAGPSLATTPTRRFTLTGAPRAGSAVLSDPQLSSLLESTVHSEPAVAAGQLLAELEFDYTEAPNTPKPRGVVAAPPADWNADPTVVNDVLDGLQGNPMVKAVTLSTLFSDVPVGGSVGRFTQPPSRRPAAIIATTALSARALRTARAQWAGFAAAVSGSSAGTSVATGLDDLLLQSESAELTAAQQQAGLARFDSAFRSQLALLSVTSRQVRLTARAGNVPITVIKTAPYPVHAVLTVTSDKIAFSTGGAQVPNTECRTPVISDSAGRSSESTVCTFVHGTNAVYIQMRSRVSGDFRISVTLNSPRAGLELASGQLTVRSMSTSAAALALSVAAGVVLLGWWGRTLWRNRRTRRGAHRKKAAVDS